MRTASTTPRSFRGTDPDEYDRVMGVTSVVRFGEGNARESEVDQEGVAHNSDELNENRQTYTMRTQKMILVLTEVQGVSVGASLQECLDRLGQQFNPAIPATCASGAKYCRQNHLSPARDNIHSFLARNCQKI